MGEGGGLLLVVGSGIGLHSIAVHWNGMGWDGMGWEGCLGVSV
jgi:hypothetical protein